MKPCGGEIFEKTRPREGHRNPRTTLTKNVNAVVEERRFALKNIPILRFAFISFELIVKCH